MVQPGNDQQAVEHAKHKGAQLPLSISNTPKLLMPCWRRPDQTKDHAQPNCRKAGDNRHKPSPAKERQILRQLDVLEAVVQPTRHQAAGDTGEHPHVDGRVHDLERGDHHQVTNRHRPNRPCRCCRGQNPPRCRWRRSAPVGERSPAPASCITAMFKRSVSPSRSRRPAIGRIAIGSISARPGVAGLR
ncbi:hypothetical protein Ddc_24320 [Ditylenchus destructor]|nr:hypothetical protein Ddc_24320 [Ditylenchus destructor]